MHIRFSKIAMHSILKIETYSEKLEEEWIQSFRIIYTYQVVEYETEASVKTRVFKEWKL